MINKFAYERYQMAVGMRKLSDYRQHFILFGSNPNGLTESMVNKHTFECSDNIKQAIYQFMESRELPMKPLYTGWNFISKEEVEKEGQNRAYFRHYNDKTVPTPIYIRFFRENNSPEACYVEPKELHPDTIIIAINLAAIKDTVDKYHLVKFYEAVEYIKSLITHELSHVFDMYVLGKDVDTLKWIKNNASEELYNERSLWRTPEYTESTKLLYIMSSTEQRAYITQIVDFIKSISPKECESVIKTHIQERILDELHKEPSKLISDDSSDYLCSYIIEEQLFSRTSKLDEFHNTLEEMFTNLIKPGGHFNALLITGHYMFTHRMLKYTDKFYTMYGGEKKTYNMSRAVVGEYLRDKETVLKSLKKDPYDLEEEYCDNFLRIIGEFVLYNIENNLLEYERQLCKNIKRVMTSLLMSDDITVTGDWNNPKVELSEKAIQNMNESQMFVFTDWRGPSYYKNWL